jgi:dTMP kinase
MKGKIITLEGLDGAGKSTQIDLLIRYMKQEQIPFKFIHFPMLNKGEYGKLIAQFLRGEFGCVDQVHPQLVALLFAEDRNEHRQMLMNWLDEDYVILMDRYVHSNIAFQCAKTKKQEQKVQLKEWILNFEFEHNKLPKPICSMFLHVPFHQIKKSLQTERTGTDRDYLNGAVDIHEDSMDLQENVYHEYLKLIKTDPNFHEVVCFDEHDKWLSISKIHERVLNQIRPLLNL